MASLKISNISNIRNYQEQKASMPSFRSKNISECKTDVVEISGKKNNNLGIKVLLGALGIGAAVLACIAFHRTSSVKQKLETNAKLLEVQKLYKEIFNRDIDISTMIVFEWYIL